MDAETKQGQKAPLARPSTVSKRLPRPLTQERRGEIVAGIEREIAVRWPYYADCHGECDGCHAGNLSLTTIDTTDGWRICQRCYVSREERRAISRNAR